MKEEEKPHGRVWEPAAPEVSRPSDKSLTFYTMVRTVRLGGDDTVHLKRLIAALKGQASVT